ncbi:MAG: hypothetical protein IPJ33_10940 [Gammaproteobacteria bacterium]|jgi:hypothetical protein|nr:hypothetical protein [Gammaproteobacteria bacterium]MBP6051019.1 hypothetical protein [Pseudomonadales bacterium]MBK6582526.1 hypothetical protein [Gammaproteobacteria bacterium]MBK7169671.1 hypothetical protein [Gammaproteobacteria bacterium]MBK7521207.1 hypothetical protein [Gammaproteobacteria bacterium]
MTERAEPLSERWREELVARLRAILGQLKNGDDAPPAQRFKAEGFAEAGLALGLADAAGLAELLDQVYVEFHGARVAELFPFRAARCIETESCRFRLPLLMRRAPVYPGSTDAA